MPLYVYGWPRPDNGTYNPNFLRQTQGLFTGQRTPLHILQFMDQH